LLKKTITSIFLVVIIAVTVIPVSAAVTESYTRIDVPGGTETNISKEMYYASGDITAASLGLEESLEGITDIFCDEQGDTLLLCGESSMLICINSDYTSAKKITVTDLQGEVNFKGAQGVYADGDGDIYIADTSNSRILILDFEGVVKSVLECPDSGLIPEDFLFQPTDIEKDDQGYTYVLSLGCYYGALLYTPEYEFMGFYGANTVETTALDTLSYLWEKLTSTDEKKASSFKTLPYSFTDFCFDDEGFMVTITGTISSDKYSGNSTVGQIKKISQNGDNILYKRKLDGDTVSSSTLNFLESKKPEGAEVQDLASVTVNKGNYIFVLDGGNGTVYIYDTECNLMSAFGGGYGEGEQLGVFENAVAITLNGDSLLVADKDGCSVTVFELTEYGALLFQAQSLYLTGDYEEAKGLWEEVISLNRNCQLAYRGLAMAYYNEENYEDALEAARIALDYSVYDLAWQEIVSDVVADNFVIIIAITAAVIAGLVWLIVCLRKRKKRLVRNPKFKLMMSVPFHPFNSFDDLKYKNQGSVQIAVGITIMFYIASVLNVIATGFLYSDTLLRNYNSLYTLGSTVGLLLLWSVCNWLVCSMFSGKGNFKEVYISTSYALVPWILFQFVRVVLTNFILPMATSGLITGMETMLLIYTFFLVTVAIIKVHEYDFFKFILTSIVTLFFMILVVFIIFMCAILIMQFGSFIVSIYEEVAYR